MNALANRIAALVYAASLNGQRFVAALAVGMRERVFISATVTCLKV